MKIGSCAIVNRTVARAENLAAEFEAEVVWRAMADADLERFDIIVNTTPVGSALAPSAEFVDLKRIHSGQTVLDVVTGDTELLETSRRVGATTIPGLRMLLRQAVRQFELYTEKEAPQKVMERALYEAVASG